ncbi:MAG: family 43 glycosylhydrolase [Bacteroidales bacterium]|nr:family 43 glycosylhydrolase [Bacteroidales bacterium]
MRKRKPFALMLLLGLLFLAAGERPVHVFMAGDSTMAEKPYFKDAVDPVTGALLPTPFYERGWGMLLPERFGSSVVVENYAQNGRSTRRFIEEGWWEKIVSRLQKGDYVVIQFAHNDGAVDKPDRYTSPEAYEQNLIRMIEETRAKGAYPILCTAVMRRKFDSQGKLVDTHGVYPELTRKVAKEKKVPLIDMQAQTTAWLESEGVEASKRFFHKYPAGYSPLFPNGLDDNTHYNEAGARMAAQFFVDGLKAHNIKPLVQGLKENEQRPLSAVWNPNKGKNYQNPILNADYSDPDVCQVDGVYYMTASSFNCIPGLPILKSYDLVNWDLVNHALPKQEPAEMYTVPNLGSGVWAPCFRYHKGTYYIFWGNPDVGIFMVKTSHPEGEWSKPVLVKEGKGLIDTSPLWDDDGRVYLVHGYAGSRYGLKSILSVCELSPTADRVISEDVPIFDGHPTHPTSEGPKFYKMDGYYYVFFPAGGVKEGWQEVLRSRNVYGPYETRRVMDQGTSDINGPHQGAWVRTPEGEDWFFHFQEIKPLGRVVHLQPMTWQDGWPVIGVDPDGDGVGEPVRTYRKPAVKRSVKPVQPAESDEFNQRQLSKQWQWYGNAKPTWTFFHADKGFLRLFADCPDVAPVNLLGYPNLLLQKFPSTDFTATAKVAFTPNPGMKGERAGLTVMGMDYAALALESVDGVLQLSMVQCKKAEKGAAEEAVATVSVPNGEVYLRVDVRDMKQCQFSYSLDGKKYQNLGSVFQAREGHWIGSKVGLFCTRPGVKNDSGYLDIDWFRVTR